MDPHAIDKHEGVTNVTPTTPVPSTSNVLGTPASAPVTAHASTLLKYLTGCVKLSVTKGKKNFSFNDKGQDEENSYLKILLLSCHHELNAHRAEWGGWQKVLMGP